MPNKARLLEWGWRLARALPPVALHGLARGAGELAWMVDRRRRAAVHENLRHVVPDLTAGARRRLVHATFRQFAACSADFLRFPSLARADLLALAEAHGLEALDRALAGRRGAILVSAHIGSFELAIVGLAALGYPLHVVVERLSPENQAAYATFREATGARLIPLGGHEHAIAAVLERGEILATGADRVRSGRSLPMPFGTGWRAVPTGPAALSLTSGAPLLTGLVVRTGGRPPYGARVEPLEADGPRSIDSLTRAMAARFASQVRAHPDQWFHFEDDWLPPPRSSPGARPDAAGSLV